MILGKRTTLWTATGLGRALLALFVAAISVAPAHGDLRSAYSDYKNGDYTHAFPEFLALAQLGQPQAQFVVAEMYRAGEGADASDIHAYAWASLAAGNGEAQGKVLAESIRPALAPGSDRIASWVTLAYTHSTLERTLLPDLSSKPEPVRRASQSEPKAGYRLRALKAYLAPYPTDARRHGIEGWVFVEFTVMPDGRTRFPIIIYAEPPGVFDDTVKESVLGTQFSHAPPAHNCCLRQFWPQLRNLRCAIHSAPWSC